MAETEEDAAMAMATAAGEAGDAGWMEIERQLSALELPPVPPTSDPQRLLSFVLNILPRYAEMEMASTHLRLYASTLEQDLEQVKGHVRILTREAEGEREKKQFLERYAAQVVKERNELLHSRGNARQQQKKGTTHLVWHSCCKKNQHHTLDVTPSLATFRGEKLQERAKQVQNLEEEVHNMELLRRELDYLLKKNQREHDSKVAAQTKQIQQLEKQVLQRSMLHSSLERKLYDVESALAQHDNAKSSELAVFGDQLKDARDRIEKLQEENKRLQREFDELAADRDRLESAIESTTETKDAYALQIDQLTFKCTALGSEVEALRSEVRILQTNDLDDVRAQYSARLKKLQDDAATTERTMSLEIDRLRHELARKSEAVVQNHDGIHDNGSAAASFTSTVRRRASLSGSERIAPRSVDYEFEEEEEKEEPSVSDTSSDLVRDLHSMLNGFEQKRKQEEEKAARAEQALLDFQRLQEDLQQLQVSPSS